MNVISYNKASYNKADFMVSLVELEDFIQELDQRWTVKNVLKKPRVVSTPLVCEAPRGAPAWAVRARSISVLTYN